MLLALTAIVVVFGTVGAICIYLLYRAVTEMREDLKRGFRDSNSRIAVSHEPSDSVVPRQIVHDLNNLLSTMGGFAEAALEDVSTDDPIRNDLREITDAAERAKGVVKRLSDYAPRPANAVNGVGQSLELDAAVRRVTSSYQIQKSGAYHRISSYPPAAKPVYEYRKVSRPPMVTPIPSRSLSSYPPPTVASSREGDDIQKTSTFPVQRTPSEELRPISSGGDSKGASAPQAVGRGNGTPRDNGPSDEKPRLLIVDDEIQLLTMFRRVFEPQGYHVTTYSDSLAAWDAFRRDSNQYDLAILDQRMPEMSGASLATEMIAIRPDFPIILLTGYSDTVSPDDAARIGIRKYLSKPIPQAKLSATIRNILNDTSA